MKFHDSQRPKLANSRPCWLTNPDHALPHINIMPWPLERQELVNTSDWPYVGTKFLPRYSLEIIIDGSRKIIVHPLTIIADILQAWNQDPEQTLEHWWHTEPPINKPSDLHNKPQAPQASTVQNAREDATIEDLGL